MGWTIFAITLVSAFWFFIGYGSSAWMMHVGRTGRSPMPAITNPFKSEPGAATVAEIPRVPVSIPSHVRRSA